MLTLWGRVTHLCSFDLYHHWFRQWLVLCVALPNSHRILFQHHTRSSFEASQALSWRSICWHQSIRKHWRTLLLAQDPLPNSPRILFRARPDHLLSLPRVPFNAPTGSSSDIKESKWVDHLYVDWPVAKQQYASNAGITGPASPARLTSYIPL